MPSSNYRIKPSEFQLLILLSRMGRVVKYENSCLLGSNAYFSLHHSIKLSNSSTLFEQLPHPFGCLRQSLAVQFRIPQTHDHLTLPSSRLAAVLFLPRPRSESPGLLLHRSGKSCGAAPLHSTAVIPALRPAMDHPRPSWPKNSSDPPASALRLQVCATTLGLKNNLK